MRSVLLLRKTSAAGVFLGDELVLWRKFRESGFTRLGRKGEPKFRPAFVAGS